MLLATILNDLKLLQFFIGSAPDEKLFVRSESTTMVAHQLSFWMYKNYFKGLACFCSQHFFFSCAKQGIEKLILASKINGSQCLFYNFFIRFI